MTRFDGGAVSRTRAVAAALALSVATVAPLAGQDADDGYVQIANEYFLTEAIYPQEARELQLTLYPSIDADDGTSTLFPLAVEYGVTDRLQIEASWDAYARLSPEGLPATAGSGDVELEARYSFMNLGGSRTHLALGFGVSLPSGDESEGVSEGTRALEPSVILARDFTLGERPAQLFAQGAMDLVDAESGADPEESAAGLLIGGGVAVGLGTTRLVVEAAWESNRWDGGDESEARVSSGLVWDLPGTWEAGVATRFGIGGDAPRFGLALILLYEFEL